MDTNEVIVDKIINKNSSDKSCTELLNVEKNNIATDINETSSSPQSKEHTQNRDYFLLENSSINKSTSSEKLKQENNDVSIVHEENFTTPAKTNDKVSSLGSIAVEYNSDSEIEDGSNVTILEDNQSITSKKMQMETYRQNTEMLLSESSEDEDDSTSSSSSSAASVASDESDSDDNTNKKSSKNNTKEQKNNEMKSELDYLPPIEELKISVPEVLCDPLGEVAWMVEQLVVVKPKPGKPTLNLDTVLFVDRGQRALGKIFDVFGQVSEPHYCVRFNSSEHIQQCDIKVGMTVYYCPNTEYTSLVFLHEVMKIKGIDATADEPPEFSDDEEERAYYEKLKAKQTNNSSETDVPHKRKRTSNPTSGWQSNHPWNRNAQRNRKGYYPRGDSNQFSFAQVGNRPQNVWPPYYHNWPQNLHSENNEQYGYGAPSLQSMQYVNSINHNLPPRIPPGYLSFQNRPNSSTNLRCQNPINPWQWVPLPPPPPPPLPTTTTTTPPPSDMN
nr:PREDICTED: H/ACA ribonucleoprotein complex non-core subunit NAF1 [Megachile rotundata]